MLKEIRAYEQPEALIHSGIDAWDEAMMGERQTDQAQGVHLNLADRWFS